MIVIPTSSAEHVTKNMSDKDMRVVLPGTNKEGKRHFPDGELYMKIPRASQLAHKHVVVLHAGAPNPNEGLVELELILQTLKEVKAKPIDVFFSYFPYGMQDEVFTKGQTNIAENLIGKLYAYYGVKNMYIIDAHFAGKQWHQKYNLRLVSAVPLLVKTAMQDFGEDILFLSPDKGGKRRTNIQSMQKKRKNSFEVEIQGSTRLQKSIRNRTVAVVDDLIETGGTLDGFADECTKAGASKIIALVTHGVLPSGVSRIKKKYDKLYLANTISRPQANVDISSLIAQTLGDTN